MSEQRTEDRSDFDAAQESAGRALVSPGAQLEAFREQRGWTVEQVASQLNLAPRQIVALESDDYPALPGMSIIRGFIRAYAKLLKVDPAPMLAMVGGHTLFANDSIGPKPTLSAPFSEARLPSMGQRQGSLAKWVFGFLVLLLAGVAFWAAQQRGGVAASGQMLSAEVKEGIGLSQDAEPDTEGTTGTTIEAPSNMIAPVETVSDNASSETDTAPVVDPTPVEAVTEATSASASQENPAASANALLFNMREESWLEIRRRSDDSVVVSRLVSAGETERVEITDPVSVVIGNAAGVDVTLRGKPVELKASTRTNVARLNLK